MYHLLLSQFPIHTGSLVGLHLSCVKCFLWLINLVFDLESGSMEFVVPGADPSAFFPINMNFSSNKIFCDLKVCSFLYILLLHRVERASMAKDYSVQCLCHENWRFLMN